MAARRPGGNVMSGSVPAWWKPYASEFPGYTTWRGNDGLYYASRTRASPPLIVRGEDADDLRDEIIREESKRGLR
jgi:hypothetical protein